MLRRGGLGDTLLTLPLLAALRRERPGAALHLAGVLEFAAVLHRFGAVDAARSSEDLALWSPDRARQRLADYDLVVADEPAVAHVALEPHRAPAGVPFGLSLARQAGREPRWPDDAWLLPPRAAGDGPTVLAPGSGAVRKCWPRERWLELAPRLGADVVVVVGPTEAERDDPRSWPWRVPVAFVAGATPVQLADRLSAAGRFVGNDSGTTHLAAALGVPTVAIFGPTDPAVWAPVGPHVRVVGAFGRGLAEVAVDDVVAPARR